MTDNFEPGIFSEGETLAHGLDGVTAIRVARYIFKYGLHSDFQASAPVSQHVRLVPFQTVVGTRFNSDANALGAAPLRIFNSL